MVNTDFNKILAEALEAQKKQERHGVDTISRQAVMSVLVKGMTMPCDCRECPMEMYYWNVGETRCRAKNVTLAEDFHPIPFDGRPEWCPLVEVPDEEGKDAENV